MKYLAAILVSFLLIGSAVAQDNSVIIDKGGEYGFEWTANTEPDLAGYRLYRSTISGSYSYGEGFQFAAFGLVVESPRYAENIEGTYYFVLTAVDDEGFESLPSIEQTLSVVNRPPNAPTGCAILKF